jgi:hypothetical protein
MTLCQASPQVKVPVTLETALEIAIYGDFEPPNLRLGEEDQRTCGVLASVPASEISSTQVP